MGFLRFGVLLILSMLLAVGTCCPDVIFVARDAVGDNSGASWEDACTSISSGMVASASGDQIWVKKGSYQESVSMKAGVELYGGFAGTETTLGQRNSSANETTIDGTGLQNVVIAADDVTIDGFTLSGARRGLNCTGISQSNFNCTMKNCFVSGCIDGGVVCSKCTLTLAGCTLLGNSRQLGGGVNSSYCSLTLINCTISDNVAQMYGGGLYLYGGAADIKNCIIARNSSHFGGGICFSGPSGGDITNCTIANNYAESLGAGIHTSYGPVTITNSILWNPGDEISQPYPSVTYSCVQGGWDGEGNISNPPLFANANADDFHLLDGSPCVDRGLASAAPETDKDGVARPGADGLVDMGAYESPTAYLPGPAQSIPEVVFVRESAAEGGDGSSWDDAFRTISSALEVCSVSDEVWVAAGTYREYVQMERNVGIYGGFIGLATETSLEQRDWTSNRSVIDVSGMVKGVVFGADDAVLDGLTLTGGDIRGGLYCQNRSPVVNNCTIDGNSGISGGGICCFGGSPVLTNCVISNNRADDFGGAISCFVDNRPILIACTISGNSATRGGGIYCDSGRLTLTECSIVGNSAKDGGGIFCRGATPTLTYCTISRNNANNGGGLYSDVGSSPTLLNSTIDGNSAYYGGGMRSYRSYPKLTNCIWTNNSASSNGGGLYCEETYQGLKLTNCVLARNSAGSFGSGVYCSNSSPTLTNTILWNPGEEIHVDSGTPSVTYCCVQGGWSGEGNIDSHPQFEDIDAGDFQLKDGSPCIDRGLISAAPEEDFYGRERPGQDGLVDIGPSESPDVYKPGPAQHSPSVLYVREEADAGGDGTSWESALPSISGALEVSSVSDEIWVAGGRYPGNVRLENTVALYGGFAGSNTETLREQRDWIAHRTIVDATNTNTSAVFGASNSMLDGFTVSGGNKSDGVGVGIYSVSDATYRHCEIISNPGGGVFCEEGSSALFEDCIIERNEKGGIHCVSSTPIFNRCTVSKNSTIWNKGGVYCTNSSPRFTNCQIIQNIRQGIECEGGAPMLTNCIMSANSTRGFSCDYQCSPTLTNCTVVGNTGGGLWVNRSLLTANNCILWNPGEEVTLFAWSASAAVTYSCVEGGYSGAGNISADPLFIDPWDEVSADLRLLPDSPCIDAATQVAHLTEDIEGTIRPIDVPGVGFDGSGDGYDMGAYEFNPDAYTPRPTETPTATPTPDALASDTDGDGRVDFADILFFAGCWKQPVNETNYRCDVAPDDIIDESDLLRLAPGWK